MQGNFPIPRMLSNQVNKPSLLEYFPVSFAAVKILQLEIIKCWNPFRVSKAHRYNTTTNLEAVEGRKPQ